MPLQLVWFKKDLRISDHQPLFSATRAGPCLGIFVYEPELLTAEDFEAAHFEFLNQSLDELRERLREIGGELLLRTGNLPQVFQALKTELDFSTIWAHQETGNDVSYQRDLRVRKWAKAESICLRELPNNGVVRNLESRDQWSLRWRARMDQPVCPTPNEIFRPSLRLPGDPIQKNSLPIRDMGRSCSLKGGESNAQKMLATFLNQRGKNYRREMSSPATAYHSCSRLSPYLSLGNISVRDVYRQLQEKIREIRASDPSQPDRKTWLHSLTSFQSRIHWHCHFIQKLEDQPSIEFQNMNRGYDGLRENEFHAGRFRAWCEGRTGFPMIDACMRALIQNGWINFRMRAMLVSFAAYQLWLHWRKPAIHLARVFLDYEPGIHYSQIQMQSGVTGINTVRIYSPIKQAANQDPDGVFIRKYVPELAQVPTEHLAEPHKMTTMEQIWWQCKIGDDYPSPIVDHKTAYRRARDRIHAARKSEAVRSAAQEVYQKHGSRRRPFSGRK